MKLYYDEASDIFCIVEGKEIWKYVGEFAPRLLQLAIIQPTNTWYRARIHPEHGWDTPLYTYLGEIK